MSKIVERMARAFEMLAHIAALESDLSQARGKALEEAATGDAMREFYIRSCDAAFESGMKQGKAQRSVSMATIVADYGADFDHHIRALKDKP